jgi:hypothetical protein
LIPQFKGDVQNTKDAIEKEIKAAMRDANQACEDFKFFAVMGVASESANYRYAREASSHPACHRNVVVELCRLASECRLVPRVCKRWERVLKSDENGFPHIEDLKGTIAELEKHKSKIRKLLGVVTLGFTSIPPIREMIESKDNLKIERAERELKLAWASIRKLLD